VPTLPTLNVCFVWHMHQPDYKDHLSGRYMMPWVRLHVVKDYLDMVCLLEEFPKIRQTFNLVPSLIDQIEDYAKPGVWDRHQEVTLKETLTDEDRQFILARFFDANPERMIARSPYYEKLFHRRNAAQGNGKSQFTDAELFDLTALFHLVWTDPRWLEKNPELQALWQKGRHYTLADRTRLLEIHRQLIADTLPTYKQFQDNGQIEVCVTPYYHPILPLLIDAQSAKEALPHITLPDNPYAHPEDAEEHVKRAVDRYREVFGRDPVGVWPSEQSVSEPTLKLLKKHGFQWAITSEGILARSLGTHWQKDPYGNLRNVETLARVYEYDGVKMVFRHLTLSDLIGFTYQTHGHGAEDLYGRLKDIQYQLATQPQQADKWVITIALDGENCWEGYVQDGVPFLRHLYHLLSNDSTLNVCRVQDVMTTPAKPLKRVHAGSWIEDSFSIWIGDPVKNLAWDYLKATRDTLVAHQQALTPEVRQQAWQEIYIAEGSDWFWWFGEPHDSGQDHLFDEQFRLHLSNVYRLLKQPLPEYLTYALPSKPGRPLHEPKIPISPRLDGREASMDTWHGAGRFECSLGYGAMHRSDLAVRRFYYGADDTFIYLRFELNPDQLGAGIGMNLYFCADGQVRYNAPMRLKLRPGGAPLPVSRYLFGYEVQLKHLHRGNHVQVLTSEAVADHLWMDRPDIRVDVVQHDVLDCAIPFHALNIAPGGRVSFTAALARQQVLQTFFPPQSLLTVQRSVVPSPLYCRL
jgi:alpha-amylase/alpha-mannosidase (GH57 family)